MPTIIEVDPHDEPRLRAFWEAEQAAIRADRAQPVLRTWDALRVGVQDPSPYHRRVLLAAVEDGAVGCSALVTNSLPRPLVDDGVGPAPPGRFSGLAVLRRNAQRQGGELDLAAAASGGTHLRWSARIPG